MNYDPKTVSEMLGIPASTLRRYAADFADQLSETARISGRKRRYDENDILLLRRIRKLTAQHLPHDEIIQLLHVVDDTEETPSALAVIPEVIQALEENNARNTARFNELHQQQAETEKRLEQAEEKAAQVDELRQQLEDIQARVDQVQEKQDKPKWYQNIKIFKRGD